MTKPHGRQTKKKVTQILCGSQRTEAFALLERIPEEQLIGPLFSHFYAMDELIKFRSIMAMGELALRLSVKQMEKARILMRRIMWNLNDESGGIGWGSPEAMGQILYTSPALAMEFKSILFSYLDPRGNFLEHELLQRGVLWGIGTYLKAFSRDLDDITEGLIFAHLHSLDPVKRGYAIRALINADRFNPKRVPEHILTDSEQINIFIDWNFVTTRICDMTRVNTDRLAIP